MFLEGSVAQRRENGREEELRGHHCGSSRDKVVPDVEQERPVELKDAVQGCESIVEEEVDGKINPSEEKEGSVHCTLCRRKEGAIKEDKLDHVINLRQLAIEADWEV